MMRHVLPALTLLLCSALPASAAPIETVVAYGDLGSARLVYGDQAAAGIRDALPAFTDLNAYRFYYKFDDDKDCDDRCLARPYLTLKRQGRIRMLTMGTTLRIVTKTQDPDDPQYQICHVTLRRSSQTYLVLCAGLKGQ